MPSALQVRCMPAEQSAPEVRSGTIAEESQERQGYPWWHSATIAELAFAADVRLTSKRSLCRDLDTRSSHVPNTPAARCRGEFGNYFERGRRRLPHAGATVGYPPMRAANDLVD